ncbi:bifunctional isochorismate lyase/aryl carrier protein [Pseudochelatococcus lubricantis]|uniref:Bifunctional isochorismate lyase/aryl carrier protein n=1 Tax=Pseudochelatococcus lubricantis TaxID=1538102 RepID=A0ABX0UUG8_9HYPH|nr:isochorismatase family protein [Pseudochelatococcus lubricantis]NIJ56412.1 bifunctional isochorismate lyase/aryl carrier protein [Pseudochelatococcus lubricantis]
MGLPSISAYALPDARNLPAARVPWRASRDRAALLIHDMQNYFLAPFPADALPIRQVIANIDRLRRHAHLLGIPIFYTAQEGDQDPRDRGLQRDFWGPGMSTRPEHQDIHAVLAPFDGDFVLHKWRYSAFQRSNLEHLMRVRNRDQLIVTGIYAHIGCLMTTAEAFQRDIEPFFVADAVADFSREKHDLAVNYAAERCAVATLTNHLLESL